MAEPQLKPSPLNELRIALPSLPRRLQQVGRFVFANDYDATTRSMRDLAAEAGADPAAFTRLAKALGYSGWDGLRAALTEARRPEHLGTEAVHFRANGGLLTTQARWDLGVHGLPRLRSPRGGPVRWAGSRRSASRAPRGIPEEETSIAMLFFFWKNISS